VFGNFKPLRLLYSKHLLSAFGREQLSDAFCVAWDGAFLGELALLAGITVKKGEQKPDD